MILTVTLNAAMDKTYFVPQLRFSEVNRVAKTIRTAGGKGLNVARTAGLLGAPVITTGVLGGHTGRAIEELLLEEGISFDFMWAPIESRTCINIIGSKGASTELLEQGDPIGEEDVNRLLAHYRQALGAVDVVTLSGSVLKDMPSDIYGQLVSIAREQGKLVILDTNGTYLKKGIEAGPTIVKPNRDEIEYLMGVEDATQDELIEYCNSWMEKGVKHVVVSLGAEGAIILNEDGAWHAQPPKLETINTVGSGDSMVGALAVGLQKLLNSENLIREAVAVSAANTLTESPGRFYAGDLEKIRRNTIVTRIR